MNNTRYLNKARFMRVLLCLESGPGPAVEIRKLNLFNREQNAMPHETEILFNEPGIQYQGVNDASGSTGAYPIQGLIVGQFKRGRLDKPMTIHRDNIKAMLGYDPKNPCYTAVQDVLGSGVPNVQVLRISTNAEPESPKEEDEVASCYNFNSIELNTLTPITWQWSKRFSQSDIDNAPILVSNCVGFIGYNSIIWANGFEILDSLFSIYVDDVLTTFAELHNASGLSFLSITDPKPTNRIGGGELVLLYNQTSLDVVVKICSKTPTISDGQSIWTPTTLEYSSGQARFNHTLHHIDLATSHETFVFMLGSTNYQ